MMPFALKKFISQFLMPMPLVCECFLLGWVLYRFTKYKKTGRAFALLAFTFFLVFGYGFGRTYLYNLERRYPPFDPTPEQCEALRGAPVVVLGQGMPVKSDLPARYQNNPVFERRLFEGIRVAKLIPESLLIVSMAGDASNSVKQAALTHYLQQLSFPTNRVTMFTTARDTAEEAKLAKQVIEKCANARIHAVSSEIPIRAFTNSPTRALPSEAIIPAFPNSSIRALILATSAAHIPRSMKVFQKRGFEPIASPCDYTQLANEKIQWFSYMLPFPSGSNFELAQCALHEWLGSLYESMTRQ